MPLFIAFSVFAVAVVIALLLTPAAIRIAHRSNAVDRPDGKRKNHVRPVALLGGLALAATTLLVVAAFLWLDPSVINVRRQSILPDLFFAAVVLIIVGLIDDIRGLTATYKLVGQVMAVSVLIAGGMYFKEVSLFGFEIALDNLSVPFTMLFCLGAVNAFNLIIGGTGSMLIGLVVAAVAIHSTPKEQAAIELIVPVAAVLILFAWHGKSLRPRTNRSRVSALPNRFSVKSTLQFCTAIAVVCAANEVLGPPMAIGFGVVLLAAALCQL